MAEPGAEFPTLDKEDKLSPQKGRPVSNGRSRTSGVRSAVRKTIATVAAASELLSLTPG